MGMDLAGDRRSVLGITDSYHPAGSFRLAIPLGFLVSSPEENIRLRYRSGTPPHLNNRGYDPDNLWKEGDIVLNTASKVGNPLAWICDKSGGVLAYQRDCADQD